MTNSHRPLLLRGWWRVTSRASWSTTAFGPARPFTIREPPRTLRPLGAANEPAYSPLQRDWACPSGHGRRRTMVDVLVIGGGNAALCAALMAAGAGCTVHLLEAAPQAWRGGNSQRTRNLRCMHDAPQDVLVAPTRKRGTLAAPEGDRRPDRRSAGTAGDPRLPPPAAPGCGGTACISSPRCRGRCTPPARTPSSWAGARRWSTRSTAAHRAWVCR